MDKHSGMNTHKINTHSVGAASDHGESINELDDVRWGEIPQDNFGYKDSTERKAKRGLEDWEMVDDHVIRNDVPNSSRNWMLYSMLIAAVISGAVLLYLIGTTPTDLNYWTSERFSNGVFVLIFFFVLVYASGVCKLIYDNRHESQVRKGEKRILIGVLLGIAVAIVFGIIQMIIGRQL